MNEHTRLWYLTIALKGMCDMKKYLKDFILHTSDEAVCDFILSTGFFIAWNRIEEFPDTPKYFLEKIKYLRKINKARGKLESKAIDDKNLNEDIYKLIDVLIHESFLLWREEIKLNDYTDKLKNLKEETLDQYIKFILNFQKNKDSEKRFNFFKELMSKI